MKKSFLQEPLFYKTILLKENLPRMITFPKEQLENVITFINGK